MTYPDFDTYGFTRPGGPNFIQRSAPKCHACGAFLRLTPDRLEPTGPLCDGVLREVLDTDAMAWSEAFGGQFAAASYEFSQTTCGEDVTHAPHRDSTLYITVCRRCGVEHREED